MGFQAPVSTGLFVGIVLFFCVGATLLGLSASMQNYADNAWPYCLEQFNVTFDSNRATCFNSSVVNATIRPGQRLCPSTPASGACGVLWVWLSGTAVAIVASCLAMVSSVLAFFWLTFFPIGDKTSQLFRVLIVFGQVAPIIFAGIAGVILSVISVQILTTNSVFGRDLIAFYVQNSVTAAFAWLLFVMGFALCSPTSNLGSD